VSVPAYQAMQSTAGLAEKLCGMLLERGMHTFPAEKGLWYLSTPHTEQDTAQTLDSVDGAFSTSRE